MKYLKILPVALLVVACGTDSHGDEDGDERWEGIPGGEGAPVYGWDFRTEERPELVYKVIVEAISDGSFAFIALVAREDMNCVSAPGLPPGCPLTNVGTVYGPVDSLDAIFGMHWDALASGDEASAEACTWNGTPVRTCVGRRIVVSAGVNSGSFDESSEGVMSPLLERIEEFTRSAFREGIAFPGEEGIIGSSDAPYPL